MARPTKYSDETRDAILRSIGLGCTHEQAAQAAGITYETLRQWLKSKPALSSALEKAIATGVQTRLEHIEQAANQGIWQASAWWLERRYPDQWGRRERMDVKHSGAVDVRVLADLRKVIVAALGDDPLARLRIADALARLDDDGSGVHVG